MQVMNCCLLLLSCLIQVGQYPVFGGHHESDLNDGGVGGALPSYRECNASYGKRDYLWMTEMRKPPMLLTFPGSGTTMTQMLLEYATGVYSGSIYDEDELYAVMPGLRACGQRLSVVKAHIKDLLFKKDDKGKEEKVTFKTNKYVVKCRNGIIYDFTRFIFVLRSPWAAWWSNWQRDFNANQEANKNTHISGIPLKELNYTAWEDAALGSPHYGVGMYDAMWHTTHMTLFTKYNYSRADDMNFGNITFHNSAVEVARRTVRQQEITQEKKLKLNNINIHADASTPTLEQPSPAYEGNKNILLVRYEDLLHKERRLHVLRKMVEFTGLGLKRASQWPEAQRDITQANEKARLQKTTIEEEELRRLKCAFVLADNPQVHRQKSTASAESGKAVKDVNVMARSADAYKHDPLVCTIWKSLQNCSAELQRYGYYHGPHQHVPIPQCDGVELMA